MAVLQKPGPHPKWMQPAKIASEMKERHFCCLLVCFVLFCSFVVVCLFVCLYVCLFVCLFVCMLVCFVALLVGLLGHLVVLLSSSLLLSLVDQRSEFEELRCFFERCVPPI